MRVEFAAIVGWGPRDAVEVVDVGGAALTPGFVDAHMHLESTKLWVDEFVRAVLPHGTTAVAADPHEIANVFGIPGVAALVAAARDLPFHFGVCASSCVPASPFESSGAELSHTEVAELLDGHGAIGVAEVMNYPGVIGGDPEMLARIATAGSRRVDGHAPGLRGRPLDAYLAAGVESDHECTELAEAIEKRMKGMWVFIRQGSASQNLHDLIPMVRSGGRRHRPDRVLHRRPRARHAAHARSRQRLHSPRRRRRGLGSRCDRDGVDQSGGLSRLHAPGSSRAGLPSRHRVLRPARFLGTRAGVAARPGRGAQRAGHRRRGRGPARARMDAPVAAPRPPTSSP